MEKYNNQNFKAVLILILSFLLSLLYYVYLRITTLQDSSAIINLRLLELSFTEQILLSITMKLLVQNNLLKLQLQQKDNIFGYWIFMIEYYLLLSVSLFSNLIQEKYNILISLSVVMAYIIVVYVIRINNILQEYVRLNSLLFGSLLQGHFRTITL